VILTFTIGQILKDSTLSLAKIKDTLYKKYCLSKTLQKVKGKNGWHSISKVFYLFYVAGWDVPMVQACYFL